MVMPMLQSKFLRNPMWHLTEGADYSHFDRKFSIQLDEFHKGLRPNRDTDEGSDIKTIMTESLLFSPKAEPGLELVDILTNAVRRGMMGHLEREGWKDIPSLMLHRKDHYIHLLTLGTEQDAAGRVFPYATMLLTLQNRGPQPADVKAAFAVMSCSLTDMRHFRANRLLLMLWTAPPPARDCHESGCCKAPMI